MIKVQAIQHITHAVTNRRGAESFYEDLLGAKVFFRGRLRPEDREASFLLVGDVGIELIDPPPLSGRPSAYLDRYGGLLYAMSLRVTELAALGRHLASLSVKVSAHGPHVLRTDPRTTHGLRLEFTDIDLPNDPRAVRDLRRHGAGGELPLGRLQGWAHGLLVEKPVETARFLQQALHAVPASAPDLPDGEDPRYSELGRHIVALTHPGAREGELQPLLNRQGPGIHSIAFLVDDLTAAWRYLRGKGIGLIGTAETFLATHPRSAMGARILLMPRRSREDPSRRGSHPR